MRQLSKGANVALADLTEKAQSITLSLRWRDPNGDGDADVSVLLLDDTHRVRSDQDFFFYNRPHADADPVQLLGKTPTELGTEDTLALDLTAVPSGVQTVVVAASRYENAHFGDLDDVHLLLSDGGGQPILRFDITDLKTEAALIFAELYRRGEQWKFRAIGQGYEGGLVDLATDFGVTIDDDADEETRPPAAAAQTRTEAVAPTRKQAVRTAKKKVALTQIQAYKLADHESWRQARVFPISATRSTQEQETRATATLLAVMSQVPEFGRRLTGKFNAPAGTLEAYTEVSFKNGDEQVRPDGVLKVARGGRSGLRCWKPKLPVTRCGRHRSRRTSKWRASRGTTPSSPFPTT